MPAAPKHVVVEEWTPTGPSIWTVYVKDAEGDLVANEEVFPRGSSYGGQLMLSRSFHWKDEAVSIGQRWAEALSIPLYVHD